MAYAISSVFLALIVSLLASNDPVSKVAIATDTGTYHESSTKSEALIVTSVTYTLELAAGNSASKTKSLSLSPSDLIASLAATHGTTIDKINISSTTTKLKLVKKVDTWDLYYKLFLKKTPSAGGTKYTEYYVSRHSVSDTINAAKLIYSEVAFKGWISKPVAEKIGILMRQL